MDTLPWRELIREPPPGRHVVVLYRDEAFLSRAVATWTAEALRLSGGAILIGTVQHVESIRRELARAGFDVTRLERSGHLLIIDAEWLTSRFMLDGAADRATFRRLVDEIISNVAGRVQGPVRAWGEMVGILSSRGDARTAHAIEGLWNEALEENRIALLCSYEAADERAERTILHDALHTHTHVFPQPNVDGMMVVGDVSLPR